MGGQRAATTATNFCPASGPQSWTKQLVHVNEQMGLELVRALGRNFARVYVQIRHESREITL
eukprot:7647145-Lingulodinium_polyedra.AAC.1